MVKREGQIPRERSAWDVHREASWAYMPAARFRAPGLGPVGAVERFVDKERVRGALADELTLTMADDAFDVGALMTQSNAELTAANPGSGPVQGGFFESLYADIVKPSLNVLIAAKTRQALGVKSAPAALVGPGGHPLPPGAVPAQGGGISTKTILIGAGVIVGGLLLVKMLKKD